MDSSQRLEAAGSMVRTLVDETQRLEERVSRRAATTRRMLLRSIPPLDPSTAPTRRDVRPVRIREEGPAPRDEDVVDGHYSFVDARRKRSDGAR